MSPPQKIKDVPYIIRLVFATAILIFAISLASDFLPIWKTYTYTNVSLGFSFNYPKSFHIRQFGNEQHYITILVEGPSDEHISLMVNGSPVLPPTNNTHFEELDVNSIIIKKTILRYPLSSDGFATYEYYFNKDWFIWIGYLPTGDTKAEQLYDDIIRTFTHLPFALDSIFPH